MKYYSEQTKQFYDSVEECEEAENQYKERLQKQKLEEENKSKVKKSYAEKIEQAEADLSSAEAAYEEAKKEAISIFDEANERASKLIDDAKERVEQALTSKLNAIKAFNERFGPYTTALNGEKAEKEFNRIADAFRTNSFWPIQHLFDLL